MEQHQAKQPQPKCNVSKISKPEQYFLLAHQTILEVVIDLAYPGNTLYEKI